jgi:septal ring factor EnvC (AmiA/AmiB activator)
MGEALRAPDARTHEREAACLAVPEQQAAAQMNRQEIEQRLCELERQIEQHRTSIWMHEFERDGLMHELRRLIHAEDSKAATP